MSSGEDRNEVDHLMEMEFRLQQDLNVVRRRLEQVLGPVAVEKTVERHLHVVPEPPDQPA